MKDIALDSSFDVFLDDRNDLGTVEGVAEFQQSVAIYLQEYLYEEMSRLDSDTAEQRVQMQVTRVARDHDMLDRIDTINVRRDSDEPDRMLVDVFFITGEEISVEASV